MIYKLEKDEYKVILPLFSELHSSIPVKSILSATFSEIWVDSKISPKTAFLWDNSTRFYLAGYENNEEFNQSLKTLLIETIFPEAVKNNLFFYRVYFTSNKWQTRIYEMFKEKFPVIKGRRFCTFNHKRVIDWKKQINSNELSMENINELLLAKTNLKNLDMLIDAIKSRWNSINAFISSGFGYCLVKDQEKIVCWCIAEDISQNNCGIAIETVQEHQRQGFAAFTASAFIEDCLLRNKTPHWDCWDDNIAAITTAEKVGFEKLVDYPVFFGAFDESATFLILGNHFYQLKRYKRAAEWFEEVIKVGKASSVEFFNAACAWTLAGESEIAVRNLHKAIDEGWTDLEHLINDADLKGLHHTKDWKGILKRLQTKLKEEQLTTS